jgi:hypothetical protein
MFHVKRFGTIDAKILASHLSGSPLVLVRPAKADVFLRLFWGRGWATMSDDPEEPESGASEAKPPKKAAEDNPWYLLATLYGVPVNLLDKTQERNRCAWNRYFAGNLDGEKKVSLIEENLHHSEELTPFSETELRAFKNAFAERSKGLKGHIELPASESQVDFSNVKFDRKIDLSR